MYYWILIDTPEKTLGVWAFDQENLLHFSNFQILNHHQR